ncbi:MAG TPA: sialate O-acetylesterase [Porphyromonadaceae bacterium]|jgi:sialate O-acetylesterase|nr:sialate O-acetylesterase [Porphyromonadaceae bacterium]HBX20404.1 sialate O-acetylesterase [Porphyromonadaceae bacterium]
MKKKYLLLSLLSLGLTLYGKPILPEILSDGMVLQQNAKVKIWGEAEKSKTIEVRPSWNKTAIRTTSNDEGYWLAVIETPKASFKPQSIVISDGEEVTLHDILIGEVWLASGQSNMEMPLNGFFNNPVRKANETIALAGQYPAVRFVTIPNTQSFEPQKSVKGRWQACNPTNSPNFSATAFFFAEALYRSLNVPIGIIVSAWGGSRVESWTNREELNRYPDINLTEETVNKLHPAARPLLMYNGMIHPISNYIVKGVIWYQGESNVGSYQVYSERFQNMVNSWRKQWNNPELPFYYVEIAPYEYGEGNWAAFLREAQFKAQKQIPHSGMISTNDLVEPYEIHNIHPCNKTDVGKRLAFMALNKTYGFHQVAAHGPEYHSMEIRDGKIILSFDYAEGGFNRTEGIEGFEIAGQDSIFLPAQAIIHDGKVEVSCAGMDQPVAVRYCFKDFQKGNLAGTRGLPMVPFRTDSFDK